MRNIFSGKTNKAVNAQYVIQETATIREALVALDGKTHDWQTLFVVDDAERMVGTLTDGDIRRGFIHGAALEDVISRVMHRNFKCIHEGQKDALLLKSYRERQILFIPVLDEEDHILEIYNLAEYHNILPIDAVLMAGGKGERLRPLTEKMPKPLLPVGGKPIIDHNVDRLISYGIKHISITVNYLKEQIEEHFKEARKNVLMHCIREPQFLGTIGSIKFVECFYNDTILVMNSDLFTNIDYENFYLYFLEQDADMSVAAVPYSVSIPYGILNFEDNRNIKGLIEKPTYDYYANAGIYLIKKSALDLIPTNMFFNATDLIEALIDHKKKVVCFPLNGIWIDIGNIQEYKRANEIVKQTLS